MVLSLGISDITDNTCSRKSTVYVLSRMNKIFSEKESNYFMIVGKVVHSILQFSTK